MSKYFQIQIVNSQNHIPVERTSKSFLVMAADEMCKRSLLASPFGGIMMYRPA